MTASIRTLAVLGAGVMGQGIAQTAAQAGYTVLLYDLSDTALERAISTIDSVLERRLKKGRMTAEDTQATLSRIMPVTDFQQFTQVDLVIEAVIEDLAVKHDLFRRVSAACPDHTIMASNTSSLSIQAIAKALSAPERLVGLHFFNPAPVMKLIELVVTPDTPDSTIETLQDLIKTLGKTSVVVQDSPAFVVNRCARPFYSEPLVMLAQSVASVADLDACIKSGLGSPLGPFELMDLVGLDVNLKATETVWEAFDRHPRFAPAAAIQERVACGELGRKTGRGFYDSHDAGKKDLAATGITIASAQALADHLTADTGFTCNLSTGETAAETAERLGHPCMVLDQNLVPWHPERGPATLAYTACGLSSEDIGALHQSALKQGVRLLPVADTPGLIVQRLAVMLAAEAKRVVAEGVATAPDIDLALQLGLNFRAGPFALSAQLDPATGKRILQRLQASDTSGRYNDI